MLKIFKKVKKFNNVWVLTHFENLDLLPLLVHLNRLHLFFANYFNSRFCAILEMITQLDLTELALSQSLIKLVEVCYLWKSCNFAHYLHPSLLILLIAEIENSGLVWREYNFYWPNINKNSILLKTIMGKSLDKSTDETVHYLMRQIILCFVPIHLISHDNNPMLFIPLSLSFKKALSFIKSGVVLVFGGTLTKVINRKLLW